MKKDIILNAKGEQILLNANEQKTATYWENHLKNALGYEIPITTLTTISKKISEQKFYEVPFADYVPVKVGEGAWSSNLVTYRSFAQGDDFSTGLINTGSGNSRLASADASVDSVTVQVKNWAKSIGWALPDLQLAAKSGNWDLITAKEKARKRNWDLGLQAAAFLGLPGENSVLGLFNQSGITTNTTFLTQSIGSLAATPSSLSSFIGGILDLYRTNCNRTAMPTHFVIPESDYLSLATPSSPTYPIKSVLGLMLETFQIMTGNKDFKILPSAYADKAYNKSVINVGTGKQVYALYNYEEESIRMDIPVDYTNTLANSVDNFSFNNVAYGQFTGTMCYRPLELLYLQY